MLERAIRRNGMTVLVDSHFESMDRYSVGPEFCDIGQALRSRYEAILSEPIPASIAATLSSMQVAYAT